MKSASVWPPNLNVFVCQRGWRAWVCVRGCGGARPAQATFRPAPSAAAAPSLEPPSSPTLNPFVLLYSIICTDLFKYDCPSSCLCLPVLYVSILKVDSSLLKRCHARLFSPAAPSLEILRAKLEENILIAPAVVLTPPPPVLHAPLDEVIHHSRPPKRPPPPRSHPTTECRPLQRGRGERTRWSACVFRRLL